jgi:hypothetical protein
LGLDEDGFVTPTENVAEEFVAMVEANGVGAQEPAHALHEIGVWRLDDSVKVVGHEAIGMDLKAGFFAGFGKGLEEIVTVHILEENILATIASAHDVIDRAGKLHSIFAWHRAKNKEKEEDGKEIVMV